MVGLGRDIWVRYGFLCVGMYNSRLTYPLLVGTTSIFVVRVGTPGHISQITSIASPVDAEAGLVA